MEHIKVDCYEFREKIEQRKFDKNIKEIRNSIKRLESTNEILDDIIKLLVVVTIIHFIYRFL